MRIAIDYSAAVNQSAGIGRFVRSLVQAIAEIDHSNEYVLMHAAPDPGHSAEVPAAPNFTARPLRLRQSLLTILWHRLHVPLAAEQLLGPIDIFHAPDFVLPPVRSAVTLLTVHDLAFLIHPECADEGLRKFLERAVPRSVARADYLLADSENTKSDLVCLMDADPDRVFVVPGGVDSEFSPAAPESVQQARDHHRITEPYILAVGTIQPRKNYPRLIEAFGRFRAHSGLPHQLVIAGGTGWLSDETFRAAAHSPFSEDICFTGHVPDSQLTALYTGADAFASVSLYEGSLLPVLEAMACGAPVVCPNTSCFPECAEGAAMLTSPTDAEAIGDALQEVCTDPKLRNDLRQRGTARAAQYPWSESAQRLVQIYEQVAN